MGSTKLVKQAARRALVGSRRFTIVSNNCWGAHAYQLLGAPYQTPFIGLFLYPDDYLKLLSRFPDVLERPLAFRTGIAAEAYPIAILDGDIEIHFLHYRNVDEAAEKWRRRTSRMVGDPARTFFKFDDRDGAEAKHFEQFFRLPFPSKVCFAANSTPYPTITAPSEQHGRCVLDGLALSSVSRKVFNATRWLSSRPPWVPLPSII